MYTVSPQNPSGSKRPMRSPSRSIESESQNSGNAKLTEIPNRRTVNTSWVSTMGQDFIYFILLNPHLTLTCKFQCSFILHEKQTNKKNWGLGRQSDLPKVTGLVTQIHDNLKACFSKWALYTAQSHEKPLNHSTSSEVLILSNAK